MLARALMVQGTGSSVGKSLLVTALCRLFRDEGLRVAPFKAQNMALNAAVTADGLEIGRAQAVQAEAAGVAPTADMNPVLIKPEGDTQAQIVVMGRPAGRFSAREYHGTKLGLRDVIAGSLARLRQQHDLIVIEGAGSPAEINLKDRDLVNMHVARLADAPVLLVGDIDRGGVFASLYGTLALLDPDERERVAALVINKFRGDLTLLAPGLEQITGLTGKPVLGVIPYLRGLRIADEDSVSLDERRRRTPGPDDVDVAVVRLPRISNHDEFQPLEHERGVCVRFVERADEVANADLVIVPGSKSTVADLAWLRASGFATVIEARARAGAPLLGICGGCQMLGESILDPEGIESPEPAVRGLGLLPLETRFAGNKRTTQVRARAAAPSLLAADHASGDLIGYEIHMGRVARTRPCPAAFTVSTRNGDPVAALDGADGAISDYRADGAVSDDRGLVIGTMIHGLLENAAVRARVVAVLRARRGLATLPPGPVLASRDEQYGRLAESVRAHVDRDLLGRLAGLGRAVRAPL